MNKIFKVIYSKTRHCYVVVSELAKSHCKTAGSHTTRNKTALTAAVLLALGTFSFLGMPTVQADGGDLQRNDFVAANDYYWYWDAKANNGNGQWEKEKYSDVFIGHRHSKDTSNYKGAGAKDPGAVTAGIYAQAGEQTVTIGNRNAGASKGSVFIGEHSGYNKGTSNDPVGDTNNYVTSVGFESDATGWGSIAIGSNASAVNTKKKDNVVKYEGNENTTNNKNDDVYGIEKNPSIEGASVALGYSAKAQDGNIAIGAYSEATDTSSTTPYVSVGNSTLKRRITNVADGNAASDVATVGQLNALSAKVGVYDKGFGINITPSTDKTKNTISLNRNLGRDADEKDNVKFNDDQINKQNALVLGGRVEKGSPTGGQSVTGDYGALGKDSVTVGGIDNTVETTGDAAVVVGGIYNKAAGNTSAVVGGSANDAIGNESSVFGGNDNDAYETYATISGGSWNKAYGKASSIFGGSVNDVSGNSSVAVGGYGSHVYGNASVGIAGGSTNADYALAAGNGAAVTVENGTAIGYQATANKEGTVAFGHDKGDVYYTSTWPQKATEKDGKYYDANNKEITEAQYEALRNADLTFNDYSQKPTVTENEYDAASYNRLVKVADGVNDHDVVVMEQLNNAKNDLKVNAGWGINIADEKDPKTGAVTKKNVISLNRNLGTNYGNKYDGKGKVTFEADGENSLILGGGAINDSWDEADKDFTYGAHAKDSVLVGGMNNDIDKNSERALIVGGTNNKTFSTGEVQQTGTDAIIVGGSGNKAEGDSSLLIGGEQNEASGLNSMIIGGFKNKNEGWTASIWGGYDNQITGVSQASGIFGGSDNKVLNGGFTYILGGENNIAAGGLAVIIGGGYNKSSGLYSSVFGGLNNTATGRNSSIIGGTYNAATGSNDVVIGGFGNLTSSDHSYVAGGTQNYVTGMAASAIGGVYSSINGAFSTGVAGGSTGQDAMFSLAAGYQSVVADGGVEKTYLTGEAAIKVLDDMYSGKKLSGYYVRDPSVESGPDNPGRLIHYDKFSTALGYQATANQAGTIAFGHDAGDDSGYTYEWETLTDDKGNPKQNLIDGTTNDYTKAPKSVKKKDPYTSAYYNRLVKVADGIDDHDVVVMEQLKQYAEKDASNIGANLKTYTVGNDGETITEADASDADKTVNENAWGTALGTGKIADSTESDKNNPKANGSLQLVTGGTVYSYNKPVAVPDKTLQYVKEGKTTGENLGILDATLNDKNHNIKYYAVDETTLPKLTNFNGKDYSNEKNDGAKGIGSMAAGFNTHADGIASTVAGSYSGVINDGTVSGYDLRGATALSYGSFNINQNTDASKAVSGVANSIIGQANVTENSNAAIIYGAGNTVTNSYRDITVPSESEVDLGKVKADIKKNDMAAVIKDLQTAVPQSGGQVMVMGGGNNVESAYMTQVVGVGNTVKGNQVQNTKSEWVTDTSDTAIKGYDKDKSSQYNYVDGFSNEVINGKHDYVIGANNKLSGDSYDDDTVRPIKRSNRSNIVIGDNHTLTREQNTVIIGSSDTENTQTKARDAVIIGHNANATNDTGADNAVAIGRSAKATGGNAVTIGVNTSAGENSITIGSESSAISGSNIAIGRYAQVYGYNVTNAVALGKNTKALVADGVAIGSESQATVKGNSAEGYDPVTGKDSTDATATWKATNAAVSIGKADGTVTRQINGLAAGTKETDAVNVAQLKKLGDNTVQYDLNTNKGKITLAGQNGTTITNVKSALDGAKDAEGKDATIATATGDALKNAANLGDLQKVYNDVNAKADKASASHTALTVEGNTPAGTGKDAKTNEDVYAGKNILLHASTDEKTGKVTYDLKLSKDINIGKPGKDGEDGKIGIDGKDGHIGLNGSDGITVRGLDGKDGTPGKDGVTITGPKGEAGKDGIDGKVGISGKDGKDAVSIAGKDGVGHIGLTGPAGTNGMNGADGKPGTSIDITVKNGYNVEGKDGKDGINGENGVDGTSLTRVVYEDANGEHQIATLEDGMKYAGDDAQNDTTKVIAKKLNNTLDIIGGADSKNLTDKNIGVNNVGGKLKVQLAKDLTSITSISNQTTTKDGDKEVTTGAKITLGTDGTTTITGGDVNVSGNKVTNVKDGTLSNSSTEAVNGKQLYSEQTAREAADTAINNKIGSLAANGNYIQKDASVSSNLSMLDSHVKSNADAITKIENSVSTLDQNAVKYDDTTKGKVTLAGGEGGTTITNVKDGSVKEGSTDAITGGQLYTEQQARIKADTAINTKIGSLAANGNYIQKDASVSSNLNTLDTQVKNNADAISKETADREAADTAINNKIGSLDKDGNYIKKDDSVSKNLSTLDTQVKNNADAIQKNSESIQNITNNVKNLSDNAVQYDKDSNKSKVTLGGKDGTTITNVKEGALSDSSTDAVNGKQLYNEQQAREAADKAITEKVTNNTDEITKIKNGDFTDASKTAIHNIAKDAVEVVAGTNTTVTKTEGTDTTPMKYAVNVEGKGKVASGDTGLISGDTLYQEVHVDKDGSYIKSGNTVGQNLSSLDTGLKTTSDLIHTNDKGDTIQIGGNSTATKIDVSGKDANGNTTGRVITGVVSDANDPNSAANVGYVNGLTAANTQQIYRDMNNAYSRLDTNINRAAAGSNALAALHPLDFDPADKASFAVGYGHYHNANAAAVGAFYQPNANTMVNMGISLGNGDPGFNAGVSFKIGKGSAYNGVSKAEMAQTIHDQAAEISTIKANDAAKDKRIDALEKENQEMKKQIQEILARLNG